jgi:multicomponent Na+:H+ antiporter subunit D
MTIVFNPGVVLLAAAAAALFLPNSMRAGVMIAAAAGAIALGFTPDFGAVDAIRRIGLDVVPLRLDALAQVFGLAFGLAALVLFLAGAHRRHRLEDAALAAHAGGALAAVYAGDLVSFVAAAQTSALAGAALVFLSPHPEAQTAARRTLGWHALAGALFTAGVGALWAATGGVAFDRAPDRTIGALLIGLALLVLAGAPLAHLWVQSSVARAGWRGAAALAVFLPKLAVYAVLRAFPGEPVLTWIGAAMALGALPLALAAGDPRRAMGYGVAAQTGLLLAAAGLATPLAAAGVIALAFSQTLATLMVMIAAGAAMEASGGPGALWRTAPLAALASLLGAAAALGLPGAAGFAPATLLAEAAARGEGLALWVVLIVGGAGAAAHFGAHVPVRAFFDRPRPEARSAAVPFNVMLALLILAVPILAIGLAPQWLIALTPGEVAHEPYQWSALFAQLQVVGAGLAGYAALHATLRRKGWPERPPPDVDILLHGPLRRGMRAAAGWTAAAYSGGKAWGGARSAAMVRRMRAFRSVIDRPYGSGVDSVLAAALAAAAFAAILMFPAF